MMKLSLNEEERCQLAERFRCTPNRRLRDRCQAILMAARGRQHRQIAEDLGGSVRTLQRWLNAYQTGGLGGLTIQWAAGRAPHIPAALAPAILGWVTQGPTGCGLDRANWTDCRVGRVPLPRAWHCRQRAYDAELLSHAGGAPLSSNLSRPQSRPGPTSGGPTGSAGL
jgi:transposase